MPKKYQDRSMASAVEPAAEERDYFFPKANPPVTIRAKSREEAEAVLAAKQQENG